MANSRSKILKNTPVASSSPLKSIPMPIARKPGLAGQIEDKVTTDFMKLMDIMES